jgi:hypothetical protein
LGKSYGGKQSDDGHHDHQFDQGETLGEAFALAQFAEQLELEFGAHGSWNTPSAFTIGGGSGLVHAEKWACGSHGFVADALRQLGFPRHWRSGCRLIHSCLGNRSWIPSGA